MVSGGSGLERLAGKSEIFFFKFLAVTSERSLTRQRPGVAWFQLKNDRFPLSPKPAQNDRNNDIASVFLTE